MNSSDLVSLSGPGTETAPPRHKSAGLAWLLSMIAPGLGHFYCGTMLRGALVLGFSAVGMLAIVGAVVQSAQGQAPAGMMFGLAIMIVPVLYVFGFLDAYFTAREISRGIEPSLMDNPRIACVLNLTTRGFGYFYLGERVKGLVFFVGIGLAQVMIPILLGGGPRVSGVFSLVAVLVSVGMAIDAYRIGRRSFDSQVEGLELAPEAAPSRLPAVIPLFLGGVIAAGLGALLLIGSAVVFMKAGPA